MNDMNNEGPKEGWFLKFRRELREKQTKNEFVVHAEKVKQSVEKDTAWSELLEALPEDVIKQFSEKHAALNSPKLSQKELAASVLVSELWDAKNKDQMGDIPIDIKSITASYFDTLGDSERPLESIKALPLTEFTKFRADHADEFSVLAEWKALLTSKGH